MSIMPCGLAHQTTPDRRDEMGRAELYFLHCLDCDYSFTSTELPLPPGCIAIIPEMEMFAKCPDCGSDHIENAFPGITA